MDENNYKFLRDSMTPVSCVFEKSIVALRVCCSQARKTNIAEREIIRCSSSECRMHCEDWVKILRQKSQFALQLSAIKGELKVLSHAKEMKVQVGGINGLVLLLAKKDQKTAEKRAALHDVNFVLIACIERLGAFTNWPFDEIIKNVSSFRLR